ncbi:MAG: hypothetical protein KCHDKBKB_00626 [Elusimicrobia bacterium]|nr:hypothetical protein [Elusimicrobiota bacterium]
MKKSKDMIMVGKRDNKGRLTTESFTVSAEAFRNTRKMIWVLVVGEFLLYLAVARFAYLLGI